jgi:hypothetical protein
VVSATVSFALGFDGSPSSIAALTSVPASASFSVGFSAEAILPKRIRYVIRLHCGLGLDIYNSDLVLLIE